MNSHYGLENMVVSASGNIDSDWFFHTVNERFSNIKHKVKSSNLDVKWNS